MSHKDQSHTFKPSTYVKHEIKFVYGSAPMSTPYNYIVNLGSTGISNHIIMPIRFIKKIITNPKPQFYFIKTIIINPKPQF